MKELLIAEMKRAIELMEKPELEKYTSEAAELMQMNKMIRKHSVILERQMYPKYDYSTRSYEVRS